MTYFFGIFFSKKKLKNLFETTITKTSQLFKADLFLITWLSHTDRLPVVLKGGGIIHPVQRPASTSSSPWRPLLTAEAPKKRWIFALAVAIVV